nr:hypothetical protein [Halomonas elongata]
MAGVEATDGEPLLDAGQPVAGSLDALNGGRLEAAQGGGPRSRSLAIGAKRR